MNISMKSVWTIAGAWVALSLLSIAIGRRPGAHLDYIITVMFFAAVLHLCAWSTSPRASVSLVKRWLSNGPTSVLIWVVLALIEAALYHEDAFTLFAMLIATWLAFAPVRRS